MISTSGVYGLAPACKKWFGVSGSGSVGSTLWWVSDRVLSNADNSATTVAKIWSFTR